MKNGKGQNWKDWWEIYKIIKILIQKQIWKGFLRRERDEEFEPYTDTSDLWVYKVRIVFYGYLKSLFCQNLFPRNSCFAKIPFFAIPVTLFCIKDIFIFPRYLN